MKAAIAPFDHGSGRFFVQSSAIEVSPALCCHWQWF